MVVKTNDHISIDAKTTQSSSPTPPPSSSSATNVAPEKLIARVDVLLKSIRRVASKKPNRLDNAEIKHLVSKVRDDSNHIRELARQRVDAILGAVSVIDSDSKKTQDRIAANDDELRRKEATYVATLVKNVEQLEVGCVCFRHECVPIRASIF